MGNRYSTFVALRRWTALAGLVAVVGLTADLIVISPAIVALTLAVATAVGWCFWLDAHPARQRRSGEHS